RVDVAGATRAVGPGLVSVPVVLQGRGDIYGVVDFLRHIQQGPRLLAIDEISVNTRSSYLDEDRLLTWSLRAHGLYPAKTSP
ncbi:MAG TPA: hypothetical protein VHG35_01560, partial [Gemmatimonadales bacterium]|nr:hypothetical protein [Gemmatimonadales bacterium]